MNVITITTDSDAVAAMLLNNITTLTDRAEAFYPQAETTVYLTYEDGQLA